MTDLLNQEIEKIKKNEILVVSNGWFHFDRPSGSMCKIVPNLVYRLHPTWGEVSMVNLKFKILRLKI